MPQRRCYLIEVHVLVPVEDNDGVPFSPGDYEALEAFILERLGGLTRLPREAAGIWRGGETTYRDKLWVYVVALSSITEGGLIREIADHIKTTFRQEAVYIRYLGVAEIL
jgi:hypothetical protein